MKKNIYAILTITTFLFITAATAFAADYRHNIDLKKLQIHWSIVDDSIRIKLVGKTKGWVAIGFNATSQMKDANIIIGYVKKGKVRISDDFGITRTKHRTDKKLKGKSNISNVSGTEKGGVTTLEFAIPLDSGDKYDGVLRPAGNTRVIAATGKRDSFRFGHSFHATLDVNLETGVYTVK